MVPHNKFKSPAKINIGLRVPFKYESGYHHITSLTTKIDLSDHMIIKFNQNNQFHLTWKSYLNEKQTANIAPAFVDYKKNLLFSTFLFLKNFPESMSKSTRQYCEIIFPKNWGIDIHIEKHIPSPSGLGGGSSNAATLIQFYIKNITNQINNEKIAANIAETLIAHSASLGADIPIFLYENDVLINGISNVEHHCTMPNLHGILGIPSFGFSTAQMYASLNRQEHPKATDKNTLQSDKESHNILKEGCDQFKFLLKNIQVEAGGKQGWRDKSSNSDSMSELLIREKEGLLIKNDFLHSIKVAYPDKKIVLNEALKRLAVSLKHELAESQLSKTVFYSLSGSGSAFYAFVADNANSPINKKIKAVIQKTLINIRNDSPEIAWHAFKN